MADLTHEVIVRRGVAVPMADGTVLRADLWLPAGGAPAPALLQRTPYGRGDSGAAVAGAGLEPLEAVARGFAVVIQDVRGSGASEGLFEPFAHEGDDGEATIAWIAAQEWSDGRVCMYGGSYVGATQLLAAARVPPPLAAVAPQMTAAEYWEGWSHQGGAFQLGFAGFWALGWLAPEALRRRLAAADPAAARRLAEVDPAAARRLADRFDALADDPEAALARGPRALADELGELAPWLGDWLAHPTRDAYWQRWSIRDRYAQITTPALHVAGWHDIFLAGTLANFSGLRAGAATEAARAGQRLIVGPWTHAAFGDTLGERFLGRRAARAALDLTRLQLDFFAAVLRGDAPPGAPVRLFTFGRDAWREAADWPPPEMRMEEWLLPHEEEPSVLHHDPADPVPTLAGATFLPGQDVTLRSGPRDRRANQARADVLVFDDEPLTAPTELTGPLAAELHVALDAAGGDLHVALSELLPDGRALHLADGITRVRAGEPGADGREALVRVELGATSVALPAGARLRVEIAASCFPRFDVHPARPARHLIFHSATRRSRVLLPFIPLRD